MGVLKPDERVYKVILAALKVSPEEALLVDDSPANVEGALTAGMDALQFVGTRPLLRALAGRGLPMCVPGETSG